MAQFILWGGKYGKLSSMCFEQVVVHHQEEFCTSSLQYFTATRLLWRCMV